jgi:hypothetical protein
MDRMRLLVLVAAISSACAHTFGFVVFATPERPHVTPLAVVRSSSTASPPPSGIHKAYAVRDYVDEWFSSGWQWGFGLDVGTYVNWRTSVDYAPRIRWFSPFVGLAASLSPHFEWSQPTSDAFFFLSAEAGARIILPWGGIGNSKAAAGFSIERSIFSGKPFWSGSLSYSIGFQ